MEKVGVQYLVRHRMVLNLAHDAHFLFAFDVELDQERLGRVDQRFQGTGVHRKVNGLAVAVDHAGNLSLLANALALFFAERFTLYAGDFDRFHNS